MTVFGIRAGFGETLWLTRDDRWAPSGDPEIVLFNSYREGVEWVGPRHAWRSPTAEPYDLEP